MGLSPDYYEHCADEIINLYADLENAIVSDITRRILKTGTITESAKWQINQLQEVGLLYDDIISEIASRTDGTDAHVRALFEDAGVKAVEFDNQIYRKAGLVPVDIRQSVAMQQVLEAGYKKTLGNMQNLTLTTANTAQTAYYKACNSAYMMVTSGAFDYKTAIKTAIQTAAEDGATVLYPSGHVDRLDVAIRRSVLTGVGQTCRTISETNAQENDCDLMEISAHSGARPSHAEWQGQIVSLSGRKGYLTKDDIGYGTGAGFGGWNCRHDWYPYFEGISTRNYTQSDLDALNEKDIEYNGKMYSEYEISQIQRKMEREIRAAKREQVAFKVAVEETDDPELRQVMQDSLNYSNSLVKAKQAKMRDFINQTGQQRDYFREQNYPKENIQKDLTFDENNGKMETELGKFKFLLKSDEYIDIEYYSTLKERFSHASKVSKKVFNKYIKSGSVVDSQFYGTPHYTKGSKSEKEGIYMSYQADFNNVRGAGATWFHEHGHMIDTFSGGISYKNKNYIKSLKKDYNNLIHKFMKEYPDLSYEQICDIIGEQLPDMRMDSAVSDLLHGLSDEKIFGCATHGKRLDGSSYWNDKSISQEAFAHMFECQSDEIRYAKMKEYFPYSLKEFERMMELL